MAPAPHPAVLTSVVNTLGSRLWPACSVKVHSSRLAGHAWLSVLEQLRCVFQSRWLLSPIAPPIFVLLRAFSPKNKAAALRVPGGAQLTCWTKLPLVYVSQSRPVSLSTTGSWPSAGALLQRCQSEGFFAPLNHLPPTMSSFPFSFFSFLEKITIFKLVLDCWLKTNKQTKRPGSLCIMREIEKSV